MTIWNIQDAGGPRVYDQLALLMAALNAAYQHYRVAVLQTLTDIPVTIPGLLGIEFANRNAMLVRADLAPGHLIFSHGPTAFSIERTGITPNSHGVFASDHAGVAEVFDLENHRPGVPTGMQ